MNHNARTRRCRIAGCPRNAARHRTICHTHRIRIARYGNPHQTHATPDPLNISAAANTRRPLPGMTPKERAAAGIRLTQFGLPDSEVARIFSVSKRTVYRWRAHARTA